MIKYDYDFIYKTLKEKGYTLDVLRFAKVLSQSTLQHLRHNQPISTKTINILCALLECAPQDFISYVPDKEEAALIRRMTRYTALLKEAEENDSGCEE